ncbi:hypothetical protein CI109_101238 [Kwoniella shandongensis]|uniref:Mmc1 C-terminal domain-containing protein n=1 Tax=Kwoniella shandongensis TaxID=1734106 RepID=A0A5M6BXK2_9TREE|nr:uncharacterized protein CI109_005443 [Kwoniella shandongensis]KAA5526165.1 hypothetical protein CI109_005443 [Kwoniella shandongensis]
MSLSKLVRSTSSIPARQLAARNVGASRAVCSNCRPISNETSQSRKAGLSLSRRIQVSSQRTYASSATAIRPPEQTVDIIPTSRPARSVPVAGAASTSLLLEDIRHLLVTEIGGADEWLGRVEAALSDLEAQRRGRIGVFGDHLAAPQDVISALLQDPLADSEATRQALLRRHEASNIEVFEIRQDVKLHRDPEALAIPSSWLQASGYDVVEVNAQDTDAALSTLLSTDAHIVVLDPIRLIDTPQLSVMLPSLLAQGTVHFVINGHLPPNVSQSTVETSLRDQLSRIKIESLDGTTFDQATSTITFVQAEKALTALDALATGLQDHSASTSASKAHTFEVFQRKFLHSNIGPLQTTLHQSLSSLAQPQLHTAQQLATLAISHISNVISADRDSTRAASHTVSELRRSAMQAASKAKHTSVSSRGIDGAMVEGGVQYEMDKLKGDIERSFDGRLSWLGLVGRLRVDDVALEMGGYLGNRFGVELERQIIFETGELSQLQTDLDHSADHIIRQLSNPTHGPKPKTHPFTSPLLSNHLSTLSLSIPPLAPTSLLTPILIRRDQLVGLSVPRLQLSAQRALLSTYSTAFLGVSMSWVSYVPPVDLISAGTATGLGLLSVVASLAMGQRLWGRAQKRFWRDWKRVTGMMKGDLQTRFATALDTQILAKPLAAAEGLEKLIQKREKRLDELQDRLDKLRLRL